jgi:hypothetical protein
MQFTGWREPISMSGLARSLAAYCADGLVFCAGIRRCAEASTADISLNLAGW